jgi:hypothetical protein
VLQEHGDDMRELRIDITALRYDLERRTDQRYRQSDATRDFRNVEIRLENVNFRFERNEKNIELCLAHIRANNHLANGMKQ